jgi:DNA-binding Lrp family transcriptional regulator
MITAFIILTVQPGHVQRVAEELIDVPGITEVHSVAGPFDLVAVARVKEHEALSDLVTGAVSVLEGVVRTETLIAFRQFAKSDPGLAWDVGEP